LIVADTSAMVALLDADDAHHPAVTAIWQDAPGQWVLPWAILPGVDYLIRRNLGAHVAGLFLRDVSEQRFNVDYGKPVDLLRAHALDRKYAALNLGLADGVVIAIAERLRASAIVTLDVRHFGAIHIEGGPRLLPRDL
jgi:predicted nucleic acid-binding protein